ncbi:LPXTG-site transpeptidase (sortase) family protein [Thermosporothrix hazakensis]|jgi:LPXTG-site transpeptidase (sortase) family protein|uniref:LPXTG-site transpeptidase (Sortase) family protein n=2 Tax=Thermosporothrix TaxID=768650 RepID=A0A326U8E1_THEHA|nr:class F sortase [Thermosporothrix hazakensis]PZW29569.1 LPXTG-site transpeptidase (sortase) family protein [Thermosporothrix hazakensis]BBH85856.1 hypothetical protein KTC_06070 [Thermosporothrix sp. COM3]GCE45717.1 hypothetical protein KTH_05860 [Thermosporothrix hazakensis]
MRHFINRRIIILLLAASLILSVFIWFLQGAPHLPFNQAIQATIQPDSRSHDNQHRANPLQTTTPTPHSELLAMQLEIPAIKLKAPVESVGILPTGEMGLPTHNPWEHVGLYRFGPKPGEKGSAVIAGHLDRPGGKPAVFWDLRRLQPGDRILISSGQERQTFKVIRLVTYKPTEAPLNEIFGRSDGYYLNLITCAGDWVPELQRTTERLVVFTQRVDS